MTLGDMIVRIGSDQASFNELQSNLEEGKAALTDFGASIEALAGATDVFANLAEGSTQMDLFGTAAGETAAQMDLFDTSSIDAADTMVQVGDAASGAAPHLADLGNEAEGAGQKAHAAGLEWGDLVDKLAEVAAVVGIATGIEELGAEAFKAFSRVQDLTTSFTLLTGSAQTASQQVEFLKEQSIALAIPFAELASTAQRMVPAFGSFEAVLPVLQAAADAAAVTGRNFDAVATSIQRIEVTGALTNKQLMQLGITWGQIATSMGGSIEEAQAALKKGGQTAEQDVAVVVKTIEDNFAGGAAAMAANLSGQWTIFKNEFEFTIEEVGKHLAPLASALLETFSGALEVITPVITTVADLGAKLASLVLPAQGTGAALKELATVYTLAAQETLRESGASQELRDALGQLAQVKIPWENFSPPQQIKKGLDQLAADIEYITGLYPSMFKAAEDNLGKMTASTAALQDRQALLAGGFGDTAAALAKLTPGTQAMIDNYQKLVDTVTNTEAHYKTLNDLLTTNASMAEKLGITSGTVAAAYQEWQKAVDALNNAMGKQKDTLAELQKAHADALNALKNATAAHDALARSADGSASSLNLLTLAHEKEVAAWKAANPAYTQMYEAMVKAGQGAEANAKYFDEWNGVLGNLPAVANPVRDQINSMSGVLDDWTIKVIRGNQVTRELINNDTEVGAGFKDVAVAIGDGTVAMQSFTDAESNAVGTSDALKGVLDAVQQSIDNARQTMVDATKAAYDLADAENQIAVAADSAATAVAGVGKGGGGRHGGGGMSESLGGYMSSFGAAAQTPGIGIFMDTGGGYYDTATGQYMQGASAGASGMIEAQPYGAGGGPPPSPYAGVGHRTTTVTTPGASPGISAFDAASAAFNTAARTVTDLQTQLASLTAAGDTSSGTFLALQAQLVTANSAMAAAQVKYEQALAPLIGLQTTSSSAAGAIANLSTATVAASSTIASASTQLATAAVTLPAAALSVVSQVQQLATVVTSTVQAAVGALIPLNPATLPTNLYGPASGAAAGPEARVSFTDRPTPTVPLVIQTTVTGNTIATNQHALDLANSVADSVMQKVTTVLRLAGLR